MTPNQIPLPYPHPLLERVREQVARTLARPSIVHGFDHVLRVAALADRLAREEGANRLVVGAAALLHDLCRNDPTDSQVCHAEQAAAESRPLLILVGFPAELIEPVAEAIAAHRYSCGMPAPSLEAQILQDADRLDAIGAIGLLRAFAYGDECDRWAYHPADPFFRDDRPLDDVRYCLDHFYRKLLRVAPTLVTATARRLAERRHAFLESYLEALEAELADAAGVELAGVSQCS